MTGDHDLFGDPAEPVGCWCATYDRAIDGPLVDFGEWNPPGQPTLLGDL